MNVGQQHQEEEEQPPYHHRDYGVSGGICPEFASTAQTVNLVSFVVRIQPSKHPSDVVLVGQSHLISGSTQVAMQRYGKL